MIIGNEKVKVEIGFLGFVGIVIVTGALFGGVARVIDAARRPKLVTPGTDYITKRVKHMEDCIESHDNRITDIEKRINSEVGVIDNENGGKE